MKHLGWLLILVLGASPAWCARKITVAQLKDLLVTLQQDKKTDDEVAAELKQVELSEKLTLPTMNSLVSYVPGAKATEQIYVLEARSAMLPPPASDIPTTPAPDAAAQKAMLAKAATYVTGTFDQLPTLTATETTLRFQDNVETVASSSGMQGGASEVTTGSGFVPAYQFIHYINATDSKVESEHGAEVMPKEKDKTRWGANGMITLESADPSLGDVFQAAQTYGNLTWLRWELVNGKPAAVYSFNVPKKRSHMEINVCCFPEMQQAGVASFSGQNGIGQPGGSAGAAGGAKGNFQTATSWHNYKKDHVPYHGELFINPDTGIVVRMITQPELKESDEVHFLNTRIDYDPVTVNGKTLIVPVKSVVDSEVVPKGDSGMGGYSTRRTMFTSKYKDYALGGGN
ncbi:MAG TPA: hypothetical protein VFI20_02860 [Terracidiphilus sp.]|nr:hypothetical protein [Terracidiphilus sp.]